MRKLAGLLSGLALVACAPLANAALTINYEIGAGPVITCGSGGDDGPVTCNFAGGGVNAAVVSSSSNSPGSLGVAEQFGSTLEVTSTKAVTVEVWFTSQDFTTPIAGTYEASLSTTATAANSTASAALTSCIDTSNGTAPALGCAGGSLTNPTQTDSGAGSTSGTVFGGAGSLSTPYSLEQELTLTLAPGSDYNVITSQSIVVPEPTSIVLLGTAFLGITALLRKKARRQLL
jgi:hypothetical protein